METNEAKRELLFKQLIGIVEQLGWQVALAGVKPDEEILGLIVGTEKYVDDITEIVEKSGWSP